MLSTFTSFTLRSFLVCLWFLWGCHSVRKPKLLHMEKTKIYIKKELPYQFAAFSASCCSNSSQLLTSITWKIQNQNCCEVWKNNWYSFKLLSLEIICYIVINNQNSQSFYFKTLISEMYSMFHYHQLLTPWY